MLANNRKQTEIITEWLEAEREQLLERAYQTEHPFLQAFYAQCIESTAADGYEVFFETRLTYNYFRGNLYRLDEEAISRFYKLAAMHHTIRTAQKRKKELQKEIQWETFRKGITEIYLLSEREVRLLEHLRECSLFYQSGFSELFCKLTVRYLFGDFVLTGFFFAFLANFWYNSYSSFMGSFTGYVPFRVRLKKTSVSGGKNDGNSMDRAAVGSDFCKGL